MTKKFHYRPLEDTSLYLIHDKEGKEYATFRLIDAPSLKPEPGCKQMELHVNREILEQAIDEGNTSLLLRIFQFVFDTSLEITHELKGYRLCKLYSDDRLVAMVYRGFAKKLNDEEYEVKQYRNWVEVRKKKVAKRG